MQLGLKEEETGFSQSGVRFAFPSESPLALGLGHERESQVRIFI